MFDIDDANVLAEAGVAEGFDIVAAAPRYEAFDIEDAVVDDGIESEPGAASSDLRQDEPGAPVGFVCDEPVEEGALTEHKFDDAGAKWTVGRDCGSWLDKASPPLEQARAIICNFVRNAKQLSTRVWKLVADELSTVQGRAIDCARGYALAVGGALLGLSSWRLYDVRHAAERAHWRLTASGSRAEGQRASRAP